VRYTLGNYDATIVSKAQVILITGNEETALFCRTVADSIRKHNSQLGDLWVCDTLSEFEQKARTPAFFGRWWYSGNADRLTGEDKRAFDRLLKNPADYGTAVLVGLEFAKYRILTRRTRKSPVAHEISASFPNRRFLIRYVQQEVNRLGAKISQGAAEAFVWRLGENYSKYDYYIELLVSELPRGVTEVQKPHIMATLKGVKGASFDDFLKYLLRPLSSGELKRTTKLFQSYGCMVEDGAAQTLRKLHYKSLQYLELRRLINEGYIPVGVSFTVDALAKMLEIKDDDDESTSTKKKKKAGSLFSYRDVLQWSDLKLKREIEIAAQVPLADWYTIAILSSKRCNTDIEAEYVLFDILTRSRRTNVLSHLKGGLSNESL